MIIMHPNEVIQQPDTEELFIDYMNELIHLYPDHWIVGNIDLEIYSYGVIHTPSNENYQLYYYNDYDDYEDGIEMVSQRWFDLISNGKLKEEFNSFYNVYNA